MNQLPNIALIGCGKMGSALLEGWLKTKTVDNVFILDPAGLPEKFKVDPPHPLRHFSNSEDFFNVVSTENIDLFVIAIKPQLMENVCSTFKHHLSDSAPILSIAAGQKISSFQSYLYKTTPVIRAMPNTPASIGKGISVAIANKYVSPSLIQIANSLLSSVGDVEWIEDEKLLDAVTALSGSGPAYVFYLIEALACAGEVIGLQEELAMKLARATVIGSAALAESEPLISPTTLRNNVTSPGGTTEAALSVLMDDRFQKILNEALQKAKDRSVELS